MVFVMSNRIKVYGPYAERAGYRVTVVPVGERKRSHVFETESEALDYIKEVRASSSDSTIRELVDDFLVNLDERGTAKSTRATAGYRLRGMLGPVLNYKPDDLLDSRCESLYRAYREGHAPDTHRGALSITKACFEWARKRRRVKYNMWADVDPLDRKHRRKDQLRIDEARKLVKWCLARAATDDGALGVLLALILGLRAHEVVGIVARDLDDGGTILHIAKSKTVAGERTVSLPTMLQAPLVERAQFTSGRLLPYKPGWVRDNTKRACRAAGVPVVCAQALRGTHATFALDAGSSGQVVAKSLGHTSERVTRSSYALPGSGRQHEAEEAFARLAPDARLPSQVEQGVQGEERKEGEDGPWVN